MNKNVSFMVLAIGSLLMPQPSIASKVLHKKADIHLMSNVRADATGTVSVKYRVVTAVESISVSSPVGTAPRLPYQVMVTYSDGTSEYRQTRWSNSALTSEEAQADATLNPVGTEYVVKGFIIGDNTTPNGYPIAATVKVVADEYSVPKNGTVAEVIPLNKVVINGYNRLTHNRDLAIEEIISWDVTQQLYNYRDTYGMDTNGYNEADGWDSPTTKLKGHGSGHYMSALAFAFASATSESQKTTLRNNMARMVNELRQCQEKTFVWNEKLGRYWEARDFAPEEELRNMKGTWKDFDVYKTEWAKYGYGYLNAIPAQHAALIEMYRAYNNESWVWAPYYSIHKQLAGLIDIANNVDDKAIADKALLIAKDMGLWIWNRLYYRTYVNMDGTQEQRRAKPGNRYEMWNMYIAGEDGGTGESLARLSEMVSDPSEKEKLLMASTFFDSPAFYNPLAKNIDDIRTRHANQHIPKITSALRTFKGNGDPYYFNLSENFWNMIQGRYRYSTGGVGNGEMFRQPYSQILSMATNVTSDGNKNLYPAPTINETCCAYNLAKLTKDLNCFNPDDAKYMDYYERVLYNQIVGSLNHHCYQTTYQYAVGLNASKPWGNETPQSTCCGGTGSENHVKYQEAVYFASKNTLWVGLYMPTTLSWDAKNVTIEQDCAWPAESSTIRVTKGNAEFELKLRVPYWATTGFDVKLNGKSVAKDYKPSSYVTIPNRRWTASDKVEITMPFGKHIDFGPDKMEIAATGLNQTSTAFAPQWAGTLMYGPLAMTATGAATWEAATIDIDSDLGNIKTIVPEGGDNGAEGNLYALSVGGFMFQPDYYRHDNSTHYFRINLMGDPSAGIRAELLDKLDEAKIYQAKNYSKRSYGALNKAIKQGELLYSNVDVDKQLITSFIGAIDAAIDNLQSKRIDKTPLNTVIADAEAKQVKDYTWDSYENLQTAIKNAKALFNSAKSQREVDYQQYMLRNAIYGLVDVNSVDKTVLGELMTLAKSREKAQNGWNALTNKVPEFSPWAIHGFARLKKQMDAAAKIYSNIYKNYNQAEIDAAAGALNAAINTMRPGNLPELEDLDQLSVVISKAKSIADSQLPATLRSELVDTVKYADMVVEYVTDGSGTHDMIENALAKLALVLKKTERQILFIDVDI